MQYHLIATVLYLHTYEYIMSKSMTFFFLPTFTCLMLHKRHLNIFLTRFCWPDFQQLRGKTAQD